MNTKAIYEVLALATKLTFDEQHELNSLLVANIKRQRKIEGAQIANKYNIGDEVVFDAKSKGNIRIKIADFSRDGSKLKGPQIGGVNPGCIWTVSAQCVQPYRTL